MTEAVQRSVIHFMEPNTNVPKSGFFWADTAALGAAFIALPFLWRRFCGDRAASAPGLAPWLLLALGAMLWRQGQHVALMPGLDRYAIEPTARLSYHGRSDAVEFLHERLRAEPGRTQGLGDKLMPGLGGLFDLETPSGPDALQSMPYHRLLLFGPLAWDWRLEVGRTGLQKPEMRRFLDLLNVRYYVDSPGGADIPGLRRVGSFDLEVYESESAWPRAFFTDRVETCRNDPELLARAIRGDGRPFAAVEPGELSARPELAALSPGDGAARVVPATDYRLTSHTTTYRVHAPGPGVAVLLENFTPKGAEVTVNGKAATAFAVNSAFAGVALPAAGDFVVRFDYRPAGWAMAAGACVLGLALLAGTGGAWVVMRRRGRAASGLREIIPTHPAVEAERAQTVQA